MMARYFIGLDDTDYGDSIGTGALSRELLVHLAREHGAEPKGITRHQFLVHPAIPYTSHNSASCIEVQCDATLETLAETCRRFVKFLFHPGADPGLCIATKSQLTQDAVAFGRRAQREIVDKAEAVELAAQAGILLEEHGGEGIGVIGALCSVALRVDGNDGRFIAHRGIREVPDRMTATELVETTAVEIVVDPNGTLLSPDCPIDTNHWIRPDLVNGRVVMTVHPHENVESYYVKKKKKGTDDM